MPGKTPNNNGKKPIDNSNDDVEMTDAGNIKPKKSSQRADDKMTVVVGITNKSKQPSKKPQDDDGDISMGGDDVADDGEKVDLAAQTVAGMITISLRKLPFNP